VIAVELAAIGAQRPSNVEQISKRSLEEAVAVIQPSCGSKCRPDQPNLATQSRLYGIAADDICSADKTYECSKQYGNSQQVDGERQIRCD